MRCVSKMSRSAHDQTCFTLLDMAANKFGFEVTDDTNTTIQYPKHHLLREEN